MKNFYEATVIKPDLKLKMVLDLEAIGICPCQIKINDQLEFYGDLVGKNTFIKHIHIRGRMYADKRSLGNKTIIRQESSRKGPVLLPGPQGYPLIGINRFNSYLNSIYPFLTT
jgi:hypothetical protein